MKKPQKNKLKPINKKKKKKKNKKRKVVPKKLDKEGEEKRSFKQYSTQKLTDDKMTREAGATGNDTEQERPMKGSFRVPEEK